MELNIKEVLITIKLKDLGLLGGVTEIHIWGMLKMEKWMVMEYIDIVMEKSIKYIV